MFDEEPATRGTPEDWGISYASNLSVLTDDDLTAVFEYLHSIPAIRNSVPDPVGPGGGKGFE